MSQTDMRASGSSIYSLSGTLECDTYTDPCCPPSCSCSLASCSFSPYPSSSRLDSSSAPVLCSDSSTIYLDDSPSRSPVSFSRMYSASPSRSQPGNLFARENSVTPVKTCKPSRNTLACRIPRKRKSRRVRTVRKKRTKC